MAIRGLAGAVGLGVLGVLAVQGVTTAALGVLGVLGVLAVQGVTTAALGVLGVLAVHRVTTAALGVLGVLAVQGVALSAGDLVGVWHLDEAAGSVVLDSSPNANDGEVRGATWTQGRFGGGLQFDGVKAHVTIPGVEALAEGTVEAWAKFDRPPSGQVGVVSFCVGYAGKNDIAILGFAPEGGPMNQLAFGICGAGWKTAKSSVVPALGQWYHLAGAWDAKGSRLYVNGSLAAEQTDWKGGLPAHAAILIGAGSWNAHLAATVDEVRIYRRALSDAEVKAHFEKGDYVSTPAQIRPEERKRASGAIVNAGDFYSAASPSSGIQEAVDSLPPSGGTVFVPSGTWLLKRGIHLRNNVSLRGAGPSTVLKRCPQVMSKLTKSAKPGEMEVTVESAKGFEVGGEVGVFDKQQRGWYITHAFVKEVRLPAATSAAQAGENALVLSKPLTKPYEPEKDAGVVNYFPAIVAEQKRNVSVEDLCVDGDLANNPGPVSDFTFAGIHFYATSDLRVTRCTVRNWPSDGIGVQGGTGNVVSGCTVEGCRGHGMHPGTSLRNSVWTDNICRKNTADGIYFCADVRYIVVSNNVCSENGANGIGGIGNGNDKFNVVSSNVCVRNGRHGIEAFDGDNNSIVSNICLSNSQSAAGKFSGISVHDTADTIVSGNRCLDDQEKPTQKCGIEESGKSDFNLFSGNNCRKNAQAGIVTVGEHSQKTGNLE